MRCPVKARIVFLEKLAEMFNEKQIEGSLAEGGVFEGDFAKEINRVFPRKKLYLFDTFSGFDARDIAKERSSGFSEFGENHLGITSEEIVRSRLPFPEQCVIKKGFFPETAQGIEDRFCFVNLDFDLYDPTLAGLKFFYPRMVEGGVILIHDYFNPGYKGVKAAVSDFAQEGGAK
ncbi:MAG: TylF/MycF family methyltransferase, partial [Helicobacteraceae bacterium]|nr:TylF/MycF family methyltransferase [Helicobacteraceae bacterium]